ncbi:MAG: allophanate hydrolase, partial [Gammaproteobacteria bacterium]
MIPMSLNLFELRRHYRDRVVKPSELIEAILARIDQSREYNVWISLRGAHDLLAEARSLEQRDPDSLPLYGIPFAVKDNIDVQDLPTTAGCPQFGYVAARSAFAVRLLVDLGAILVGKTNLDQFATGLSGTRSPEPYGICRNAFNPDYIAGGSSSGSAVAVALNLVTFSVGTDTAGSGRIPAAFNNLVGFKPSRGLIGCSGLVPACKSLDCVSLFSRSVAEAAYLFDLLNVLDRDDRYARENRALLEGIEHGSAGCRIGVPKHEQLEFFGDGESPLLFRSAIDRFEKLGATIEEIDFAPFLEAATMLYEGPWIAERYAGIRLFLEANPGALHPVTEQVYRTAMDKSAIAAFEAFDRLAEIKHQTKQILTGLSCMVVPTAARIFRIDEVLSDPIAINSKLGYYTNFMNLLDFAAIAVPAGTYANGLPFGITLFASALSDLRLLSIAGYFLHENADRAPGSQVTPGPLNRIKIAVCGAHMRDLPLNNQLLELEAHFCTATRTAAKYKLFALNLAPPPRPGL